MVYPNRPLYVHMASAIGARKRCDETGNNEWFAKWTDRLGNMLEALPHGSGIDGTWAIDFDASTSERIVLTVQYHNMNSDGYYAGWSDLKITIKSSLQFGYDMRIVGGDADLKDYLQDCIGLALTNETDGTEFV